MEKMTMMTCLDIYLMTQMIFRLLFSSNKFGCTTKLCTVRCNVLVDKMYC